MKKVILGLLVIICMLGMINLRPLLAQENITVRDMVGRNVRVPKDPKRIICIAPGTLRLIIYLEAKNKVVGVEDIEKKFPATRPYWVANNELGRLPSIGPGGPNSIDKEPDLEKILAVRPEVIFITYMGYERAESVQRKIGIPVVVLTYGPFGTFNEKVYDALKLVGKVLNKEARARKVISFIQDFQKDLLSRVEGFPENDKPSVYVGGIGFKGTHGIESTQTIYAPFEWVKAKNVAKPEGKKGHLFVDKEKILSWNPDFIFIDGGGSQIVKQDYKKRPDYYQGLKAFRNRRVYILHSFNWYMTNIGTVVADAYAVGKVLYPKRFNDVDLAKRADEIYTFLLGRPVYEQMSRTYGHLAEVPAYLK